MQKTITEKDKQKCYKQCQDCRKVFLIPKSSRIFNEHSCPFCESWNTGYIDKKMYEREYNINLRGFRNG